VDSRLLETKFLREFLRNFWATSISASRHELNTIFHVAMFTTACESCLAIDRSPLSLVTSSAASNKGRRQMENSSSVAPSPSNGDPTSSIPRRTSPRRWRIEDLFLLQGGPLDFLPYLEGQFNGGHHKARLSGNNLRLSSHWRWSSRCWWSDDSACNRGI
jgi:hypothetical protein